MFISLQLKAKLGGTLGPSILGGLAEGMLPKDFGFKAQRYFLVHFGAGVEHSVS